MQCHFMMAIGFRYGSSDVQPMCVSPLCRWEYRSEIAQTQDRLLRPVFTCNIYVGIRRHQVACMHSIVEIVLAGRRRAMWRGVAACEPAGTLALPPSATHAMRLQRTQSWPLLPTRVVLAAILSFLSLRLTGWGT